MSSMFDVTASLYELSQKLRSQKDVLQTLRTLCMMRAPLEPLQKFKVIKYVKRITKSSMSSEIINLAGIVDTKIQKLIDEEFVKQKEEEEKSATLLEESLSSEHIQFVSKWKSSSDRSSSSPPATVESNNAWINGRREKRKRELEMEKENWMIESVQKRRRRSFNNTHSSSTNQ